MKLALVADGVWAARWPEAGLRIVVAGDRDAPHPARRATLDDVVTRWGEVRGAIERFVRTLPPEARVPLASPRPAEAFAAGDCGFEGTLRYEAIVVTDADPSHAKVTFFTGAPDGYVTFEATLERGVPTAVTAFFS